MVAVDRAVLRQPVTPAQRHFARDVADGRGDRRHGDFPQVFDDGIAGEDQDRAFLVGMV